MSTEGCLSSITDAASRRRKRDRTVFTVGAALLTIISVASFTLGALLGWKSETDRSKDNQVFIARCTHAGFNQQQCDFLTDLR